jgi:hypothetical protein
MQKVELAQIANTDAAFKNCFVYGDIGMFSLSLPDKAAWCRSSRAAGGVGYTVRTRTIGGAAVISDPGWV